MGLPHSKTLARGSVALLETTVEKSQLRDCCEGFFGILLQDDLPAAGSASINIFLAVIQVEHFRAALSGHFFESFVDPGVGFHRADFVGENVAVEIAEEWEIVADVGDGEVVGIGKNVSRDAGFA